MRCFESTSRKIHRDQRSGMSGKAPNRLQRPAHLRGVDFQAEEGAAAAARSRQHHPSENCCSLEFRQRGRAGVNGMDVGTGWILPQS